jgi:hypothetical protein
VKRKWDWRPLLTPDERRIVEAHEAALLKVKRAQDAADKTRGAYIRVANRALQRAKYQGRAL